MPKFLKKNQNAPRLLSIPALSIALDLVKVAQSRAPLLLLQVLTALYIFSGVAFCCSIRASSVKQLEVRCPSLVVRTSHQQQRVVMQAIPATTTDDDSAAAAAAAMTIDDSAAAAMTSAADDSAAAAKTNTDDYAAAAMITDSSAASAMASADDSAAAAMTADDSASAATTTTTDNSAAAAMTATDSTVTTTDDSSSAAATAATSTRNDERVKTAAAAASTRDTPYYVGLFRKYCNARAIPTSNVLAITVQKNRTTEFSSLIVDMTPGKSKVLEVYPAQLITGYKETSEGDFLVCYSANLDVVTTTEKETSADSKGGSRSSSAAGTAIIHCSRFLCPWFSSRRMDETLD